MTNPNAFQTMFIGGLATTYHQIAKEILKQFIECHPENIDLDQIRKNVISDLKTGSTEGFSYDEENKIFTGLVEVTENTINEFQALVDAGTQK